MPDTPTKDRLTEIRDWLENHEPHPPFVRKALHYLFDEVERLQDAYEHSGETIETYSEALTKAETKIEQLRKEIRSDLKPMYDEGLKVTGIVHEKK